MAAPTQPIDPCAKYDANGVLDVGAMLSDAITLGTCIVSEFKSITGATTQAHTARLTAAVEAMKAAQEFHTTAKAFVQRFG